MNTNTVFARKILEDLNIKQPDESRSLFPDEVSSSPQLLSLIQELIDNGSKGNLCIRLKSDTREQKEKLKAVQSELKKLPSGCFVCEEEKTNQNNQPTTSQLLYFQKTWQAKRDIEEAFLSLIQSTDEYRKNTQEKYSEEKIEKIIQKLENKRRLKSGQEDFALKKGQKKAILEAVRSPFHIITGGPGTGKTTVVAFLMEVLNELGELPPMEDIALAAPTGRAGQRLTESIQENWEWMDSEIENLSAIKGTTIHRLLRFQIHSQRYYYNKERSFLHRLVLVDEVSMVDIFLFQALLHAIPSLSWNSHQPVISQDPTPSPFPFRFILLGDPNQLPSVEKGAVLNDILAEIKTEFGEVGSKDNTSKSRNQKPTGSQNFFLSNLTESNRHSSSQKGKEIWRLAESLLKGESKGELDYFWKEWKGSSPSRDSTDENPLSQDFRILDEVCKYLWTQVFQKQMEDILAINIEASKTNTTKKDIAIQGIIPNKATIYRWTTENKCLTLYRRGMFGIEGLQSRLQKHIKQFLWKKSEGSQWIPRVSIADKIYYPGLPILVTKNDAVRKLFNGDIGFILLVKTELRACFLIDGSIRSFALDTLPEHEEAYFLTVHKSQGSEYKNLYFYIPPKREENEEAKNPGLANRQILYTGITRAKENLVVFGSREGWDEAIRNSEERLTGFRLFPQ